MEANTGWVRVSGLTKHYPALAALQDVSFDIRRGEILRPPVAGKIGLWAKTDTTSLFQDYVVSPK